MRLIASDAPFAEATLARLAPPDAHENVTHAVAPGALGRLSAARPLLISGAMDAHPSAAPHDGADLRLSGRDVSHVEEPFP